MRIRCLGIAFVALAGGVWDFPALAGQHTTDGIAAIVNDEVISMGEVHRAARLLAARDADRPPLGCGGLGADAMEPPSPGRSPDPPAEEAAEPGGLAVALECLIDGTLVFREVRRFPQLEVTRMQVLEAYDALVEAWPSREAFERELQRAGLSPAELQRDLRRQLLVAAYVENRFRGTVDVTDEEARTYFDETLAPDMRERGIEPPPFEDVADAFVVPILREREVNRRVESWIQDLRARADIDVRYPESR